MAQARVESGTLQEWCKSTADEKQTRPARYLASHRIWDTGISKDANSMETQGNPRGAGSDSQDSWCSLTNTATGKEGDGLQNQEKK